MKSEFRYTGIRVKDLDASIRFYANVLGLTPKGREKIEATKGIVVDMVDEGGHHLLELNYYEPGSPFDAKYDPGEGLDHLGFHVADLDRAIEEARKAGHPVVQEIKTGSHRWVYIQDPNGIWIELFA
jgi:lactoylglutathione lyase